LREMGELERSGAWRTIDEAVCFSVEGFTD